MLEPFDGFVAYIKCNYSLRYSKGVFTHFLSSTALLVKFLALKKCYKRAQRAMKWKSSILRHFVLNCQFYLKNMVSEGLKRR